MMPHATICRTRLTCDNPPHATICRTMITPRLGYDDRVRVFTVEIVGYLTAETFGDELERVSAGLHGDSVALLFDILRMTGYEPPVRDLYIGWHAKHKAEIAKVAVVTDRSIWRMVVSAVGLAVRAQVKTFTRVRDAKSWCEEKPLREGGAKGNRARSG
jgi:hypothetical protein